MENMTCRCDMTCLRWSKQFPHGWLGATCYPLWSMGTHEISLQKPSSYDPNIYPHIFGHEICCVPNHFPSISQYPIPVATKQPSSLIFSRRVHHEVCSILMRENPNALRTTRSFVLIKIWVLCPGNHRHCHNFRVFFVANNGKMVAFILYVRLGTFSWMVVKLS